MKKILIVDDSPNNLELLAVVLEFDYSVVQAENGQKALDVAWAESPDLILMDLSMPIMDGWGALKGLRADERTRETPVLAVTAHALKGDREKAIKAGFDDYVTKPIAADQLMILLDKILSDEK